MKLNSPFPQNLIVCLGTSRRMHMQGHIFLPLLCAPGHAPTFALGCAPNCPWWGRKDWGQYLCRPQKPYLRPGGLPGQQWHQSGHTEAGWQPEHGSGWPGSVSGSACCWCVCCTTYFCSVFLIPVSNFSTPLKISSVMNRYICATCGLQCLKWLWGAANCACALVWIHPLGVLLNMIAIILWLC